MPDAHGPNPGAARRGDKPGRRRAVPRPHAARLRWRAKAAGGCIVLALGWPAGALAQAVPAPAPGFAERVAALVDAYREAHGLAALRAVDALARLAESHSRHMAESGQVSHDGFRERFERAGSSLCVENVAARFDTPEALVDGWRSSPEHDRNLLDPRVARMGVAARGRYLTLLACR